MWLFVSATVCETHFKWYDLYRINWVIVSYFCGLLRIYELYSENYKKCLGMLRKKKYRCGNAKSLFLFSRPAFFHSLLHKVCTFISDIEKLCLSNSGQVIQHGKKNEFNLDIPSWEKKKTYIFIQIRSSILAYF